MSSVPGSKSGFPAMFVYIDYLWVERQWINSTAFVKEDFSCRRSTVRIDTPNQSIRFAGSLTAAWFTLKVGMKLSHSLLLPALAAAFAASAYAQTSSKPADDLPDAPTATAAAMTRPNGPTVVMDTSMGRITCQFFQRQAPKAVANFIGLAEGTKGWTDPVTHVKHHGKPLYNGTIFHRVIPEFMIQGGDPAGTGMGDPGYQFDDEFDPNLNFDVPGRLAMANSGPNTNGSQFFITEAGLRFAQPALHSLRPMRRRQCRGGKSHCPRAAQ